MSNHANSCVFFNTNEYDSNYESVDLTILQNTNARLDSHIERHTVETERIHSEISVKYHAISNLRKVF